MDQMNDLKALLKHDVQMLVSVEDQIIEALPAMIKRASNQQLKKALDEHLNVTEKTTPTAWPDQPGVGSQQRRCNQVFGGTCKPDGRH